MVLRWVGCLKWLIQNTAIVIDIIQPFWRVRMTLKLKRSVLVLSLGLIAIIGMSAVLAKVMSYTPKPQSVVFNIVPSNANFPLESQVIGARMSADDGLVGHVLTITNTAQT